MTSIFKFWQEGSILVTDAGWGDSGKGKCVSALKPDICAKIIGGHNAGHTILTDKGLFGLGLIPSTITDPKVLNIIGQEVVINPFFLIEEINKLNKAGVKVNSNNLKIDFRSHLVLPWHELRDTLSEEARGKAAIGSLHLGVGWAFSDRINRRGLRLLDLMDKDWKEKVKNELANQLGIIDDMKNEVLRKTGKKSQVDGNINYKKLIQKLAKSRNTLKPYTANTIDIIWKAIDKNKKILFEDSHGAMLDVSHGSWPFTTGVNTSLGAVQRSFGGKATKSLTETIACIKAYQTRVGGGPMPTENVQSLGKYLQEKGGEVGTRSGRARRCGPIDLPLLKYGLDIAGLDNADEIALTKLDVLTGLKQIPVCVSYFVNKRYYKKPPQVDANFLIKVKPVYKLLDGWDEDISNIRSFTKLPPNAQKYILFLEKHLTSRITFIGVGQHKNAIILR